MKRVFLEKLEELEKKPIHKRELSIWDVALEVLGDKEDIPILTLKADLLILRKFSEGFSTYSISLILGIPEKNVIEVAKTWGFRPVDTTLDFSPLYIYEDGMDSYTLMAEINNILPININKEDADKIIHNIERYYELLDFLKEME